MDRTGLTYMHRVVGMIALVTSSKPMSSGTTRHTLICLDQGPTFSSDTTGQVLVVDDVPVSPFEGSWKEV